MYKNKIPYQLRTADPSTLVPENLLTLANIITSGIDHYSPSLGAFTSVQVAMPYLQKHETTSLSERFRHIPPTISKAANT